MSARWTGRLGALPARRLPIVLIRTRKPIDRDRGGDFAAVAAVATGSSESLFATAGSAFWMLLGRGDALSGGGGCFTGAGSSVERFGDGQLVRGRASVAATLCCFDQALVRVGGALPCRGGAVERLRSARLGLVRGVRGGKGSLDRVLNSFVRICCWCPELGRATRGGLPWLA
jgi:hypothetical protein